jgi:GTPase SAR1 family protein
MYKKGDTKFEVDRDWWYVKYVERDIEAALSSNIIDIYRWTRSPRPLTGMDLIRIFLAHCSRTRAGNTINQSELQRLVGIVDSTISGWRRKEQEPEENSKKKKKKIQYRHDNSDNARINFIMNYFSISWRDRENEKCMYETIKVGDIFLEKNGYLLLKSTVGEFPDTSFLQWLKNNFGGKTVEFYSLLLTVLFSNLLNAGYRIHFTNANGEWCQLKYDKKHADLARQNQSNNINKHLQQLYEVNWKVYDNSGELLHPTDEIKLFQFPISYFKYWCEQEDNIKKLREFVAQSGQTECEFFTDAETKINPIPFMWLTWAERKNKKWWNEDKYQFAFCDVISETLLKDVSSRIWYLDLKVPSSSIPLAPPLLAFYLILRANQRVIGGGQLDPYAKDGTYGMPIMLQGVRGAGKTTLIHAFVENLGVGEIRGNSPTVTQEYKRYGYGVVPLKRDRLPISLEFIDTPGLEASNEPDFIPYREVENLRAIIWSHPFHSDGNLESTPVTVEESLLATLQYVKQTQTSKLPKIFITLTKCDLIPQGSMGVAIENAKNKIKDTIARIQNDYPDLKNAINRIHKQGEEIGIFYVTAVPSQNSLPRFPEIYKLIQEVVKYGILPQPDLAYMLGHTIGTALDPLQKVDSRIKTVQNEISTWITDPQQTIQYLKDEILNNDKKMPPEYIHYINNYIEVLDMCIQNLSENILKNKGNWVTGLQLTEEKFKRWIMEEV